MAIIELSGEVFSFCWGFKEYDHHEDCRLIAAVDLDDAKRFALDLIPSHLEGTSDPMMELWSTRKDDKDNIVQDKALCVMNGEPFTFERWRNYEI